MQLNSIVKTACDNQTYRLCVTKGSSLVECFLFLAQDSSICGDLNPFSLKRTMGVYPLDRLYTPCNQKVNHQKDEIALKLK